MNTKSKSDKSDSLANRPKIRTLELRVAVTDSELKQKVKRAFDLAKSAGQELDLTFTQPTS